MIHDHIFPGHAGSLRNPGRVARLEPERVVALCLADVAFESVLDVGTGSGLFAECFARHGLKVAGVDVRAEMVDAARAQVPGGDFRVALAGALPFPDGAFDLVFMGVMLHEAGDRVAVLREAARVARQRVAVLEWAHDEARHGPPPAIRISPEIMADLAREAGLRVDSGARLAHTSLFLLSSVLA